jgi:hypothetical protein
MDAAAPTITSAASVTAAENITAAAYLATAVDPAGRPLSWSLTGEDAARFAIDAATGAVTFLAPPDFEAPADADGSNSYRITLQVTGDDPAASEADFASKDVTITVTNLFGARIAGITTLGEFDEFQVDDSGRKFAPDARLSFVDDGLAGATMRLSGALPEDSITIARGGTGPGQIGRDGDSITFGGVDIGTVTDAADGFSIVFNAAATGEAVQGVFRALTYQTLTDRPTLFRTLTTTLEDATGLAMLGPGNRPGWSLGLIVNNSNDAPVFTSGDPLPFPEIGGFVAYRGTAIDPDGDALRFRLFGDDADRFTIDPISGVVRFRMPPDFDAPGDADGDNVYEIDVHVSDGAIGVRKPISIVVTDVADAPWQWPPASAITLGGFGPAVVIDENAANATPQRLAPDAVFTAPGSDFGGQVLRIEGLLAEDRLVVVADAPGPGAIGRDGDAVTRDGVTIATVSGGAGTPLAISFAPESDAGSVQAVLRSLAFATESDTPVASRTLSLTLADAAGALFGGPLQSVFAPFATNPFAGLDVGDRSAPRFVDLNDDGLLDLVSGRFDGGFSAFRNTGSFYVPFLLNPLAGIDAGDWSVPAFADLDGDGRLDLIAGDASGFMIARRNTEQGFVPFTTDVLAGANEGAATAPAMVDLDGDGVLDIVAGDFGGTVRAWRDIGDGFLPFDPNPFAGLRVGFHSSAAVIDLDRDGRVDLILGDENTGLKAKRNTGAGFVDFAVDPVAGLFGGVSGSPVLVDLDGDGRLDLVTGARDGTFAAFRNVSPSATTITLQVTSVNDAPRGLALSAASVAENSAIGTVIGTVSATDPEGDAIGFSIVGDAGPVVLVGGELRVAGAIDFEATPSLSVTLRATDSGGAFSDSTVVIAVRDVAEAGPAPGFAFSSGSQGLGQAPAGPSVGVGGLVQAGSPAGLGTLIEAVGPWNSVKNAFTDIDAWSPALGQTLTVGNFVDVRLDLDNAGARALDVTIVGAKRGEVFTAAGDDALTLVFHSNEGVWNNTLRVGSGSGNDLVNATTVARSALDDALLADNAAPANGALWNAGYDGRFSVLEVELGEGNDSVTAVDVRLLARGGAGNDAITGGRRNDAIDGGDGDDMLTGGAGADRFLFDAADGADTVSDFSAAQGDKIVLAAGGALAVAGAGFTYGSTSVTATNGHVWTAADFLFA